MSNQRKLTGRPRKPTEYELYLEKEIEELKLEIKQLRMQ